MNNPFMKSNQLINIGRNYDYQTFMTDYKNSKKKKSYLWHTKSQQLTLKIIDDFK